MRPSMYKGILLIYAIIITGFIQLFRTLFGAYLDMHFPPAYSYRNNYIEAIAYATLTIYLIPVVRPSLTGIPTMKAVGFTRPMSGWSWLVLFPMVIFILSAFIFPLQTFNGLGLVLIFIYSALSAFGIEMLSRGIILGILLPFGNWWAAILTGILLTSQGTGASILENGISDPLRLLMGIIGGASFAFAMAALRLRMKSIYPVLISTTLLEFAFNLVRQPAQIPAPIDYTVAGATILYGIGLLYKLPPEV